MNHPRLNYFKPDEFREWWPYMSPRLLVMLDVLRHQWGKKIEISGAGGALGRNAKGSLTQHNVDKWGEVRAADIFPAGVATVDEAQAFWDLIKAVGFTGRGVYPDALPSVMFHVDVRVDRRPGQPSDWGALRRMINRPAEDDDWRYVSVEEAMREVG